MAGEDQRATDAGRAAHNALVGVVEFYGALLEQGEREKLLLVGQIAQARALLAPALRDLAEKADLLTEARALLGKTIDAKSYDKTSEAFARVYAEVASYLARPKAEPAK